MPCLGPRCYGRTQPGQCRGKYHVALWAPRTPAPYGKPWHLGCNPFLAAASSRAGSLGKCQCWKASRGSPAGWDVDSSAHYPLDRWCVPGRRAAPHCFLVYGWEGRWWQLSLHSEPANGGGLCPLPLLFIAPLSEVLEHHSSSQKELQNPILEHSSTTPRTADSETTEAIVKHLVSYVQLTCKFVSQGS